MDQNRDIHRLEKLNKDIYSRDFPDITNVAAPRAVKDDVKLDSAWKNINESGGIEGFGQKKPMSPFKKFFIASLIFFGVASIFAAIMFFGGFNIVSADKVNVSFFGPVSIAAGDKLGFRIVIENNNATPLLDPVLYINYPDGTKQSDDLAKNLIHDKEEFDDIPAGETAEKNVSAVLFGVLRDNKEIKVTVEYGIRGSNALFRKEKTYPVVISATPLSITVDHPAQAAVGDLVEIEVSVTSNSNTPLKNILLRADYPFGFAFKESEPKASFENATWEIPSLSPGEKKSFTIRGLVEGEENDERVFRFTAGLADVANEKVIATAFLTSEESIILRKPPIAAVLSLNDSSADTIATNQGSAVRGRLVITNNLPSQLVDTKIQVVLSGTAFDPASPQTSPGYYRSIDKTIIWDKTMLPSLGSIDPGGQVAVSFSFSTLSAAAQRGIKNGTVTASATVVGKRVEDTGAAPITASASRTAKVETLIGLVPRIVYSIGPFSNTGPVPPKADIKTTYTIIWTVTNSLNNVTGMEVRATLPAYVTWAGVISPANEKITWNSEQNEIVWRVGDVPASATPTRQVAFQVSVLPSLSQLNSAPVIISGQKIQAVDSFTNQTLTVPMPTLTTNLSTDPKYITDQGLVTR